MNEDSANLSFHDLAQRQARQQDVANVAPLLERVSSAADESLHLERALRALQRRVGIIAAFALTLPLFAFFYDILGNTAYLRERVPSWLRAKQRFEARLVAERSRLAGISLDRLITAAPSRRDEEPSDVSLLLQREDFRRSLARAAEKYLEAMSPTTADIGLLRAQAAAGLPEIELTSAEEDNGALIFRVSGGESRAVAMAAASLLIAINDYSRHSRGRELARALDLLQAAKAETSKALQSERLRLRSLSGGVVVEDSSRRLEIERRLRLMDELFNLEIEEQTLRASLAQAKAKADYDRLCRRFYLGSEDDISKVLVEGNPLRMEWAALEAERERLQGIYTDDHPRMRQLRADREALLGRLAASGAATSQGNIPPLPTPEEARALCNIREMAERLDALGLRLQASRVRLSQMEEEERQRREAERGREKEGDIVRQEESLATVQQLQARLLRLTEQISDINLLQGRLEDDVAYNLVAGPTAPAQMRPRPAFDMAMALLLGLAIGCALAFLLDSLDKRFHSPFDVAYHLRLPYLGVVPRWLDAEKVIKAEAPDSHRAEIYAHMCANIRHALPGNPERKLLVVSATKGEGKSTVAANLAIRYALEGNSVILVDADIRCPQGHRLLEVEMSTQRLAPGLSEYLAGEANFAEVIHSTATAGLRLIPAGQRVRNPVRLFYTSQLRTLLDTVEREAEVVIFDCPAVLPVVDATILAPYMRGLLLVIAAEEVDIEAVRMAVYRLQHVGARLCGAVLNKVAESASRYVYYGRYRRGAYYDTVGEKET